MADPNPRTLVLGLGNPILTDDGVGIAVERCVAERCASQNGCGGRVVFAEASVGGLRLLDLLNGHDSVILIDAIQIPDGLPGDIHCSRLGERPGRGIADLGSSPSPNGGSTLHAGSTHDFSLPGALAWGRQHGLELPADDAVLIVAIEAQDVLTFGETCTPAVSAAIPRAADVVLGLIEGLNG